MPMPTRKQAAAVAILLCFSIGLFSCSSYRHRQFRADAQSQVRTDEYTLQFIEADDEGWFWEPRQASAALDLIHEKMAQRDTIVVVFIHGWHHSARCCDDDVEGFKETLLRLRRQLQRPAHAPMKRAASQPAGERDINVIGIYLGWRGRSLPGWLNYATFWGRKSSAERVGNTDFGEFLSRLNDVYLQYNPSRQGEPSEQIQPSSPRFLGMVTIGHSFGAQVLLRAVSGPLEEQLIHKAAAPGYLRDGAPTRPQTDTEPLRGIGDLLVLLNPAVEAAQYQRLHSLSRSLRYPPEQTPIMLTVSATNDVPRHKLFTFGRILGEFFTGKPRKADVTERDVERKALGVYPGHATHRLEPTDDSMKLVPARIEHRPEAGCEGEDCACEFLEWQAEPSVTEPNSIAAASASNLRAFDFSGPLTFNNVRLVPEPGAVSYQPFIVAEAGQAVIDGHNGIFTEPFLQFLVSYIAFVETKSAELR